jgi:predicted HTH transcriptional regulator
LSNFKNILSSTSGESRAQEKNQGLVLQSHSFEKRFTDNAESAAGVIVKNNILGAEHKVNNTSASNQETGMDRTAGLNSKILKLPETKERRSIRQEHILRVLSAGTPMSIGEIGKRIKGCSEKTIQRELQELVDSKRVIRIGEKRWSKYLKA